MTGFRAEVIWPVVLGEEDWHTLAAAWRREHPEIRGVSWTCTHSWHPPTDTRGPIGVRTLFDRGLSRSGRKAKG